MTSPSPRSGPATTPGPGRAGSGRAGSGRAGSGRAGGRPPPVGGRPLLRAARHERGWSQADAARELSALAERTGVAVAGPASLKTQLSRWENAHAAPEPEYRTLLGALYDRDAAGLGLVPGGPAADLAEPPGSRPGSLPESLPGALAEAGALDPTALALLREQLEATVRLDHRLGPAGAADVLAAQVERLVALADHVLPEEIRRDVCTVLAEAALLAGDLERDRARAGGAWARYGTARAAAHEAGRPDLAARARAARARLLLDAGEPDRARTLLGDAADEWSDLVRAEAALRAPGAAPPGPAPGSAAPDGSGVADGSDIRPEQRRTVDAVRPAIALDVDVLAHRRTLTRAAAGDARARVSLERTTTDEDRPVRARAEASAALAAALLRDGRPADAAVHARRAQLLAMRIGAPRITALADTALADAALEAATPDPASADLTSDGSPGRGAQRSVAPARSSSAAE
ncbi:helix-turn-helix transcriptional regulator [Pseudonocardia sp. KRD291]|uniref:helix-turn-helix domain-containing protein n=1 Tax=Pseudonocardia sp. KRD291 TaxID=2792007 RepID=UPI001C4A0915|nr:helix-turn-helix transcriptional regulator [Pseudonocardia sp. KRD291]MBW0105787.1 helix-turn-helix transcriptional regulator [Pseudonocardia sp. KRD291]